MKRSNRRHLAPLLAVVIATASGMTLAAFATAQASTNSALDRQTTARQATTQTIVNRRNNECLSTQSWRRAEQVRTRGCDHSVFQQWSLIPTRWENNELYYKIVNAFNGMCLDVLDARTNNWAQVVQWTGPCVGVDNQLWKKQRTWNGSEMLRPKHTNKCLDISWGAAVQYECNGSQNQEFWIR